MRRDLLRRGEFVIQPSVLLDRRPARDPFDIGGDFLGRRHEAEARRPTQRRAPQNIRRREALADSGSSGSGSDLLVAPVDPEAGMPGRWYGYDAAKAIVIDTNDSEAVSALSGDRGESLVDWVRHGGHLIVSIGENWEAATRSALGPILPAVPKGRERVASLEALDTFASANKPITPPGSPAARRGCVACSTLVTPG